MHIARVAPILLLAACSRAPDMAKCRLVGTWLHVMPMDKSIEAQIRASGKNPEEIWAAVEAQVLADGIDSGECFASDGSFRLVGKAYAEYHPKDHQSWLLISDRSDRIVISILDPNSKDGHWSRTFVFESPDMMREKGGMLEGMKFKRVTPAK